MDLDPAEVAGHLPFLSRLASLLVEGDPEGVVRFRQAGIVCLSQEEGKWTINWVMPPDFSDEGCPTNAAAGFLRRDPAEVEPWAETCGQIRLAHRGAGRGRRRVRWTPLSRPKNGDPSRLPHQRPVIPSPR
jgi:hypothetical protein